MGKRHARHGEGSLFKRGSIWWLKIMLDGKEQRFSMGTADRREAEERRKEYAAPLLAGNKAAKLEAVQAALEGAQRDHTTSANAIREKLRDKLTVADAWGAFVAAKNRNKCSEITLLDYAQRWAKFTDWWPTHAPDRPALEEVTRADAQAFAVAVEAQGLSSNRYNKIVQTARLVFTKLADQYGDKPNPFGATARAGISNQTQVTVGRRELSEGELCAVCGNATGELRTLLAIGLYTGLRLGDACNLRWETVNLPLARLTVQPHKTLTRGGKVIGIPLHPVLAAILEETPPTARRDFILPNTAALYLRDRSAVVKSLRRLFRAAGIETTKDEGTANKRSLVGFHSLRHSFVSICAAAGVPLAVVQELCGHGSPAIQRAYLHINEGATRAAIATLPDVMTARTDRAAPLALPPAAEVVVTVADADVGGMREELAALARTAMPARVAAALAVIKA